MRATLALASIVAASISLGVATSASADIVGDAARGLDTLESATDRPGPARRFAVELNPLGLFLGGRFSANVEWAIQPHDVLIVSPHIIHTSSDSVQNGNAIASQTFSGVGTEVGYRYYTGHRGMNGLFIGPSFLLGLYNGALPSGEHAFTSVGLAVDVGLNQILWDTVIVGGGLGLQYTKVSHDFGDLPISSSLVAEGGVKPRFLASAGVAF